MLGTLPEGYRPVRSISGIGLNTNHGYLLRYTITGEGNVYVYAFCDPTTPSLLTSQNTFTNCRIATSYCLL